MVFLDKKDPIEKVAIFPISWQLTYNIFKMSQFATLRFVYRGSDKKATEIRVIADNN